MITIRLKVTGASGLRIGFKRGSEDGYDIYIATSFLVHRTSGEEHHPPNSVQKSLGDITSFIVIENSYIII